MSTNTSNIPRATGLLIIEARNSNPNGDPDRESDPRTRSHDGRGVISDVSFKRKLRELILAKEGPVWAQFKADMSLNDDDFGIHVDDQTRKLAAGSASALSVLWKAYEKAEKAAKEAKGNDAETAKLEAINAFEAYNKKFADLHWDVRVFGSTALEEGKKSFIRTGVAQFGIGVSGAKVRIQRDTNTVKANVDANKDADRGMAPLGFRIIEHGVYAMPFLVNPTAALKSGCQLRDIELLCRLIPYAYAHNPSRVRPFVEVRQAWYFQHNNGLGSASDFAVIDALTPTKADPSEPSASWADYNYDGTAVLAKARQAFEGKFQHFGDLCDASFVNQVFPPKAKE
jgi:CRISPR-associated protein Csd2